METNNNNSEFFESPLLDSTAWYKLRSGEQRLFDISTESCLLFLWFTNTLGKEFGFYFGDRVKVRSGQRAWVIGVRKEREKKNLYFHVDGDNGASYYADFKKEDFEKDKFELIASPKVSNLIEDKLSGLGSHRAPAFENLLRDGSLSDVVFKVEDTEIKAHKIILVARSEYFRAMFLSGMKESTDKTIPIQDVSSSTFRNLLQFIYTGTTPVTEANIVELFGAAEMFQVPDLKELCILHFPQVVNGSNVFELLLLASAHEEIMLKSLAKKYILKNWSNLHQTEEFKILFLPQNQAILLELMKDLAPKSENKSDPKPQPLVIKKRKTSLTLPSPQQQPTQPTQPQQQQQQ